MTFVSQPPPYTASPARLAIQDILLFLRITIVWPPSAGIPSIILPIFPFRSGRLDELYPDYENLKDTVLQLLLFIVQGSFFLTLIPSVLFGVPLLPLSCTPISIFWIVVFFLANRYFCTIFINGTKRHYESQVWRESWDKHDDEKWIFINGVTVGDHWMQSNLDRIALTFRRRIHGIHNQTRGIIFDVAENILQRTFDYATPDVRAAFRYISDAVTEEKDDKTKRWKKIVLILHSQGAVEGGLVIDWLLATVETSLLKRIEVYTFGCAANHFNSPVLKGTPSPVNGFSSDQRVIKHIEHYANLNDYVSRFGILHFRPLPTDRQLGNPEPIDEIRNLYIGRLFARKGKGHQFNGNYLDSFFTMNSELTAVLEDNDFMSSEVNEKLLEQYDIASKVTERDVWAASERAAANSEARSRKLKDVSRLWLYRNGKVPRD